MKTINLSKGKVAKVDNDDFNALSKYKWHYNSDGYARRSVRYGKKIKMYLMHREIMGTPAGKETDHINGDRLDNRKSNLRVCSLKENRMNRKKGLNNTSGIKGVCWNSKSKKWQAGIKINRKSLHLGLYETRKAAGLAYKKASSILFGRFARN